MAFPIFDSHAHYLSTQFDADRAELLSALPEAGVTGVIECAIDGDSSKKALELCHQYPFMRAALGIHPESLIDEETSTVSRFGGDWRAELAEIRTLFEDPAAVAVGECGLDYHWPVPKEEQLLMFEEHLKMSLELDKPIIVHDREAHADTYALLKKYKPKGVVHCFSGAAEDALTLVKQGMYIGLGGAVTFKGARRALKVIDALNLSQIVLETDCPYMSPVPCRGQRCDSRLIAHTGAFIAERKGIEPETLFQMTEQNARRLFNI